MRCSICHDKIEAGNGAVICFGCRLDAMIPAGYERREDYVYIEAYGHRNARQHPPTGVQLLDATPLRLSQILIPRQSKLPRSLA